MSFSGSLKELLELSQPLHWWTHTQCVVWDQPITMCDFFSPSPQIKFISLRCRGDTAVDQLLLVSFCWIQSPPALSYLAENTPAPHTTSERVRACFSRLALWMSALFFLRPFRRASVFQLQWFTSFSHNSSTLRSSHILLQTTRFLSV